MTAQLIPQSETEANLNQHIWQPAFFNKLASYGIEPSTPAERESLLRIGNRLALEDAARAQQKTASDRFSSAATDLDAMLSGRPSSKVAQEAADRDNDQAYLDWAKSAAEANPALYNNVFSAACHMATQLAG